MTGIERIAAERQRQIDVEGWTPQHDDRHTRDELAMAAVCYAQPQRQRAMRRDLLAPLAWPWEPQLWRPTTPGDRVRELVKAGALIAAEIDRLQRANAKEQSNA